MAYDIHCYGNGEILKGIFDAVAMCINGKDGSLFMAMRNLSLIMGVFWALIYALYKDFIGVFTTWIIPMTIFMNVLFVPSTSVWLKDPVLKRAEKVDNVPYGLAVFVSYVTRIGHGITAEIEKVFTLPDDLKYHKSGYVFASNIIQQAKTFHITNSDLAENMREFVGHCVVYDAMLGRKYTLEDLKKSDDIWQLVSSNASPVRMFLWRAVEKDKAEEKGRAELITCSEGVKRFNAAWTLELNQAAKIYGKKLFAQAINPQVELMQYLPIAYATVGKMAKQASEILKQQMMIYAVVEGVEHKSAVLGNAPNWAARKAYLQQRSNYETLGAMAGEALVTMKAVLEALVYAAFILILPLALMPFGWRILSSWAQIVIWLQMWAPLYAILNYVITMAATVKTTAALSMYNEAGVAIATNVGVANINADMAAMAGYLSLLVPFICIALTKGLGSFVHLASQLTGVTQAAAGSSTAEALSGNYSMGNLSVDNQQFKQSHMLSTNMAASYQGASFKLMEGRSAVTSFADGGQLVDIGTSNLPVNLNWAESMSHQYSQMSSQSYQKALNFSESSAQHLSSSYRDMVDLNHTLGKSEHMSDGTTQAIHSEQALAINKSAQMIQDFAKNNNISTQKSADIIAQASVGLGLGKNSLGMNANSSISTYDNELLSKASKFAQSQDFQEVTREAVQASKQLSSTLSDEKATRLAQSITGSYEQGENLRQEANKSFRTAEDYNTQAMRTQSQAASINANYNQQFIDWLAEQKAENTPGKMGHRQAAYLLSNQPNIAHSYAKQFISGLNTQGTSQAYSQAADVPLTKEHPQNQSSALHNDVADSQSLTDHSHTINGHKMADKTGAGQQDQAAYASLQQAYSQETGHNLYSVTKDHMETVNTHNTLSDNLTVQGQDLREQNDHVIAARNFDLNNQAEALSHKGQSLKADVTAQEGRWVSRRVLAKGIDEMKSTAVDVADFVKQTLKNSENNEQSADVQSKAIPKPHLPHKNKATLLEKSIIDERKLPEIKLEGDPQQK